MIGFLCCKYISIAGQTVESKIKVLKVAGLVMVALGFGLSPIGFGINKRIWSPSYVFVTCGFASWILGILVQFIDGRGAATDSAATGDSQKKPQKDNILDQGLLAFGMNPLFLYVMSEALAILFGSFGIKADIFAGIHSLITDDYVASLTYAPLLCSHPRRDGSLDVSQENLHQTIGSCNFCIDKSPYCIKKHKNRVQVRKIICIFAPK